MDKEMQKKEEERRNYWFSFIVGCFIAMGVIILLVVLFPK